MNDVYDVPEEEQVVIGGTRDIWTNRMRELSTSLDKVPKEVADSYDFSVCETLEEVKNILQTMVENDHHLVGTRNYVYNSDCMFKEVKCIMAMVEEADNIEDCIYPWNRLTRTNGLRLAVINIIKNELGEPNE